jgi:GNAT superfamily N-acetyltransferase
MTLRRITTSGDPLLSGVPQLYEEAFPPIARIESSALLQLIDKHQNLDFYAICEGEDFCGFAMIWNLGTFRYFNYLATRPECRNKGLGAQTIAAIRQSPLPFVGEVEPPVTPIQKRRLAFYQRQGLVVLTEHPTILNRFHPGNDLWLIASQPLTDLDFYQQEIIDKVYKVAH